MNDAFFEAATWYHALSLSERLATLQPADGLPPGDDTGRAAWRLERWRTSKPFEAEGVFARKLARQGLTAPLLQHLLGEPIEAVRARTPECPAWLVALERALLAPASGRPLTIPSKLRHVATAGFLALVQPWLEDGVRQLHGHIDALSARVPGVIDPKTVSESLSEDLSYRLMERVVRTLVFEMHVARHQGLLRGDTPDERFRLFVETLHDREVVRKLMREYPVLARQLAEGVEQWVRFNSEFLTHVATDTRALEELFVSTGALGTIVRIEDAGGDNHRGGRSVRMVTWSSGLKLVYKPRSLAVDLHFQELLAWLNARGTHPPLRLMRVLDRTDHGWCEFLSTKTCESEEELQRFYERLGTLLAVTSAIGATDIHYENLLASGEHPMLVDLEALFHPVMEENVNRDESDDLIFQAYANSVMRVGLLPNRLGSQEDAEGADLSAMGSPEGHLAPMRAVHWEGLGTDEMRLERKRMKLKGSQNQPMLRGKHVRLRDYEGAFLQGYTAAYRLLLRHRDALLAPEGPLARFSDAEVRIFLRSTRTYVLLLRESFHPDALRCGLDRDRMFDFLWFSVKERPQLERFIPSEKAALQRGDIPLFSTRPGTRDVWGCTGEHLPEALPQSGLEMARERLLQLSERDLERQCWFIRASLSALEVKGHEATPIRSRSLEPAQDEAGREQLLAEARAVGERLEALAVSTPDGKVVNWLSLRQLAESSWSIDEAGADLYGGLSGIALFYAYLGHLTGEARWRGLARTTLDSALMKPRRGTGALPQLIGLFAGWGSSIYVLTHLGTLWNEPHLLDEAERYVEQLPERIARDEHLDIISGSAGCIGALLALYRLRPTPRVLEVAIQCGERLLARGQVQARGLGWKTRSAAETPLGGFSHGASGMAWALLELASASGDSRFLDAAREALAYERGTFSPEQGNWLDLRARKEEEATGKRVSTAWCHGAPGIGLARLHALRHLEEPWLRDDVDVAIRATLQTGFGANHSLCHGDLGNLELLVEAGHQLGEPRLAAQARRLAAAILKEVHSHGWRTAAPNGLELPGLMLGLAGIGYGLLRLADPAAVPSVLSCGSPPEGFPPEKAPLQGCGGTSPWLR